jgi:uncharacterized small protein (DUF1192 family)
VVLFLGGATLIGIALFGLMLRAYISHRGSVGAETVTERSGLLDQYGPINNAEELIKKLKDDIDRLNAQLKNAQAERDSARDLDTQHPVLGLFSPTVTDNTKTAPQILTKNFTYNKGNTREPTSLSFELHNSEPGQSVQKGYIVVLARTKNALYSYPNVFNQKGPFILDFEKGESFQVSRFRVVNAQFDQIDQVKDPVSQFQILIFRRNGELLLNLSSEVSPK